MAEKAFNKRISRALRDQSLQKALERSEKAYVTAREKSMEGVDFESSRSALREVKDSSILEINELFERFRKEAEGVGARVYTASDADEAKRLVLDIAAKKGAKNIAKAKSMLTEEIDLNDALIEAGINVTETDLGEWICQLAGERPSHFPIPAIHKTREDVAKLFRRATGEDVGNDIPELVEVARKHIRKAFLEADIGITGANIAIADTGTLVIVSNEGNARLVSSLPDVHIALVGYEKLLPTIDEAAAVIKLLPRCGTGQKITTYVSFITGPSRTSDIEKTLTLGCHGPKELHIIFVDNGRLAMANDPDFRQALNCIKCGSCLSMCPVYHSVGGHVFGHRYMGGIGAILTAFHAGLAEAEDIAEICTTCGRCTTYCPVKMDIPGMVASLRKRFVEKDGQPFAQRMILGVLGEPEKFDKAVKLLRMGQKIFLHNAKRLSNIPFTKIASFRELPLLAEKSLHELTERVYRPDGKQKGTVAFFPGCVIEEIYPEIGFAVIEKLRLLGWEVRVPEKAGCCGMPALLKGDIEDARKLAKHILGTPEYADADYIITACPTCLSGLKKQLPEMFAKGSEEAGKAMKMAEKSCDFSSFVAEKGSKRIKKIVEGKEVTYHDPCHARHGFGIGAEPRRLLELAGYRIAEMEEPEVCCGFAGSFSISHPDISGSIARRKIENIEGSGAEIVATDCPGCIMQIRGALEKKGSKVRVAHTAELIEIV